MKAEIKSQSESHEHFLQSQFACEFRVQKSSECFHFSRTCFALNIFVFIYFFVSRSRTVESDQHANVVVVSIFISALFCGYFKGDIWF
jgi:hypothetical protein